MTVIDERRPAGPVPEGSRVAPPVVRELPGRSANPRRRRSPALRPGPARPATAPLGYRGYPVGVSRAPHRPRPVSGAVTMALAGLAALITLWLGTLAHFSGDRAGFGEDRAVAAVPEKLAVVRVQAGETLQQIARRVAPDAPAGQVVDRIRDLNRLGSAALDAGQTLIAPLD